MKMRVRWDVNADGDVSCSMWMLLMLMLVVGCWDTCMYVRMTGDAMLLMRYMTLMCMWMCMLLCCCSVLSMSR